MNVIIIETHNKENVEWGISLTDHNPTSENYIGCKDYEYANKLKNLLDSFVGENFSKIHHEIVSEIVTVLTHLGAGSGIVANVASWGDTQDSENTLDMLKGYREKFIDPIKGKDFNYGRFSNQFQRQLYQYSFDLLNDLKQ